jgi:monoamine oxidase
MKNAWRGQGESWQPLRLPQRCREQLKTKSVAVVGGGLAGLLAARVLCQNGINVTVFEARTQVGGRVLSTTTFSNGRIIEEGAELIGSFHTKWLELAREYGLAVVSRMGPELYEQAGLDVKLILDKPLKMDEFVECEKAMQPILLRMAGDASQILDPSQPWQQPSLATADQTTVANALEHRYEVRPNTRLWKMFECPAFEEGSSK